eukprot:140780-Pelagomonas_calceolata.AAC.8
MATKKQFLNTCKNKAFEKNSAPVETVQDLCSLQALAKKQQASSLQSVKHSSLYDLCLHPTSTCRGTAGNNNTTPLQQHQLKKAQAGRQRLQQPASAQKSLSRCSNACNSEHQLPSKSSSRVATPATASTSFKVKAQAGRQPLQQPASAQASKT